MPMLQTTGFGTANADFKKVAVKAALAAVLDRPSFGKSFTVQKEQHHSYKEGRPGSYPR